MVSTRPHLFRRTDLFAVLGVLLLSAWAPAYLAQSEATRDALGENPFTLPPARVGDRVVYGLVAQWGEEDPVAVAPVVEVVFRAPRAEEAPYRSSIVEEWTWPGQHVDLGFSEYLRAPATKRTYYDEAGNKVWTERAEAQAFPNEDDQIEYKVNWVRDGEEHWVVQGQWPDHPMSTRTIASGTEVRRDQDWGQLAGLFGPVDRPGPQPVYLRHVADHPLGALYGAERTQPLTRLIDSVGETFGDGDPYLRVAAPGQSLHVELTSGIRVGLMLKEGFETEHRPEQWNWYHPDLPVAAGAHVEARDAAGARLYALDLVPLEIERGTGDGMTPAPFDTDGWKAVPRERASDIERVPLGEAHHDTRPILRTVSIADVWATLSEGPSSIQDLVPDGHLVGFTWLETRSEVREVRNDDPETPEGVGWPFASSGTKRFFHSDWVVALTGPGGTVRAARIELTDTLEDGVFSARVEDACDRLERPIAAWPTQIDCRSLESTVGEQNVVSSHAVLEWVQRWDEGRGADQACHPTVPATGSAPCQFAWLPVFVCDIEGRPGLECQGSPLLVDPEHAFNEQYHITRILPYDGYARWATPQTTGRFDLGTGLPLQRTHTEVRPSEGSVALTTAETTEPFAYEGLTPTSLAAGGFLLVVLSLLLRVWVWGSHGGAAPLFAAFYARVTKQDALTHERREEIVDRLRMDPGLTVTQLAERLHAPRSPTLHHLETLRRTGHTTFVQNGRRRHWFVAGEGDPEARLAVAMEHDPVAARFLAVVRDTPGITLQQAAERVGRSKYAVSRTGSRLAAAGLVAKQREGRTVRFRPTSGPLTAPTGNGGRATAA